MSCSAPLLSQLFHKWRSWLAVVLHCSPSCSINGAPGWQFCHLILKILEYLFFSLKKHGQNLDRCTTTGGADLDRTTTIICDLTSSLSSIGCTGTR